MVKTEVKIPAGMVTLEGSLAMPEEATTIVLFVHGSGSGRHSPRNQFVARVLNQAGLATLYSTCSHQKRKPRTFPQHNIGSTSVYWPSGLSTQRNGLAIDDRHPIFESATSDRVLEGAAALVAAAERAHDINAVVSRGGRPDLAGDALARVQAPALLIVETEKGNGKEPTGDSICGY